MEQFSLEKYLENPSRKIVTRDGRSVRIICTDANEETPIAALVTVNDMGRDKLATALYTKDGRYGGGNSHYDLFFADEEERLSEFEKSLSDIIGFWQQGNYVSKDIKTDAKKLLDLARKELEKEVGDKCWEAHLEGEKEALESLPKWKKATEHKDLEKHIAILEEDKVLLSNYLEEGDYYIELSDLKTLPKEE